jgi:DNA topoisomerase-3
MNATRLYTVKHGGFKQVLSIDVQTPTLAMVVDRFKEIENFNNPIGNCKPCTEKRCLIMRMVDFKKEDGQILADKVKQ